MCVVFITSERDGRNCQEHQLQNKCECNQQADEARRSIEARKEAREEQTEADRPPKTLPVPRSL